MTGRLAAAALTALTALGVLTAAGCAAPGPAGHAASGQVTAGPAASGHVTAASGGAACDPQASSFAPGGPPNSSGGFAAAIKARGYLVVGVDQSTYHFGFLNPIDNQIEGFDIDMIDAVAQSIFGPGYQSRIHYKAIPDSGRIPALTSGAVDIVAHTMTITCARLQQIDFSAVYYNAHAELLELKTTVTPQGTPKSLADLKGQKVCATTGSTSVGVIQDHGAIPVQVAYWTDCLVDLQQGLVSGVVTDDSILHGLQAQDPFTAINAQQLEDEPYGLGIANTHPDFVRFVNAVLTQIESNGTWERDYARWVGGPAQSPPPLRYAR